jgi:hypothetical protein
MENAAGHYMLHCFKSFKYGSAGFFIKPQKTMHFCPRKGDWLPPPKARSLLLEVERIKNTLSLVLVPFDHETLKQSFYTFHVNQTFQMQNTGNYKNTTVSREF